jgi:hypothetical protein
MSRSAFRFLLVFSIAIGGRAFAHHSFATHYYLDQLMEITGTVTELTLRNPHSFLMIDVTTAQGTVERWEVEAHAIPLMRRLGIGPDTIRLGDTLTVTGPTPRRTDKNVMFGGTLLLADGTEYPLLGALGTNLIRDLTQDSPIVQSASDSIVEKMSGRWGKITAGSGPVGDSPMPLNAVGLDARAAYDPRNTPAMNCVPPNLPSLLYAPYLYEIRSDDSGTILYHEYQAISRRLSLGDGAVALTVPPAFGRRISRIEGDTLIVESTEFAADAAGLASDWDANGRGANIPSSDQKRLVENYTISDDGKILTLDYTVQDPVYLAEPYTDRMEWQRLREDAAIYEFECDTEIATRSTLNAGSVDSSN